ncbi:VUT family protein [Fangia hongkongensis]|uniref:VUT family protein n=1 Tax=Fangia hongkongensis TaxID=270495 RepID=UPI00037694DB|nr:VUT family protein [Fangia hongkongensis]MBK2124555.1 VUT family protein [Fangia hongkongensis]
MRYFRLIFGVVDRERMLYTMLYSLFFISLTSATLSVLDVRNFEFEGYSLSFAVGLLFFPLTFVISNFIQDRYDIRTANTVVFTALVADGALMLMLYITSSLGESQSSYAVYSPLIRVWSISFFSIIISCIFNNIIFKYVRKHFKRGFWGAFVSILTSSTMAEIILTCISLPLILSMSQNVSSLSSVMLLNLVYKFSFTGVASIIVAFIKTHIEYKRDFIENKKSLYVAEVSKQSIV